MDIYKIPQNVFDKVMRQLDDNNDSVLRATRRWMKIGFVKKLICQVKNIVKQ